ncbi:gluconokinase [Ornithinicoccus hortensis]|uniref:Gluconokinase n=1 Tax=Ornithinicoccus hortensis TaxID=82346 RepID=A0A542YNN4_9MICO|nr:gluconokinase [Ornithinicoccus hortensis]TQL49725.1 gluconate kinase (SKI family) [Ornithinicoccus hortensis]
MSGDQTGAAPRTHHVVVIGVSGSGKSTIAAELAGRLNLRFADADDFHPPANVAKMSEGIPLTDEDRLPWLQSLATWMRERGAAGESTVLACSALKRSYRDLLREGGGQVAFLHLDGPAETILSRMRTRDHFMPPSLLESQVATLEPLEADEPGTALDLTLTREEIVDRAEDWLVGPGGLPAPPDRPHRGGDPR